MPIMLTYFTYYSQIMVDSMLIALQTANNTLPIN